MKRGFDLYLVSARVRRYDGRVIRVCFAVLAMLPLFATAFSATDRPAPRLYRGYCASCHGSDGKAKKSKGRFSHARDLTDAQWQDDVSDERIFNSIMNGRNVRGNMPAFADKLNENEINSLVTFVRSLK